MNCLMFITLFSYFKMAAKEGKGIKYKIQNRMSVDHFDQKTTRGLGEG